MIYTIMVDDGLMGVNRDFRKVNLESLGQEIETVQFDTERNTGIILYKRSAKTLLEERDLARERQEERDARVTNKDLSKLVPRYRNVSVSKRPFVIAEFTAFEYLLALWEAAAIPERRTA